MAKKSYDEIVNNIFKFFSIKQNKSIKKSAVEEYCNHTDNNYDSWNKLFEKLKKGNGEWRIIVTDKENEEYRIVPANVPFDENAPPKPPAKNSSKPKKEIKNKSSKSEKKRLLANADTARKTKNKNTKSAKTKNKKTSKNAGRKSKYGDYPSKAARILNALSENRYYDKNKLIAIAKNIGVSIGVWNTLLKHLRKGTKTHDFVDNGKGGVSKKYKLVPKTAKKMVKKSVFKPAKVASKQVEKTQVDKPAPREVSQPPQVESKETTVQSEETDASPPSQQKSQQQAKIKIPGDGRPVSITINIEIG